MEPAGQHSGKHRPSGRLPAGGRDASELSPAAVAYATGTVPLGRAPVKSGLTRTAKTTRFSDHADR